MGKSGQGTGRKRQDLRHTQILGSMGGCFGVPRLMPDLPVQTKTNVVLIRSIEILAKVFTREWH